MPQIVHIGFRNPYLKIEKQDQQNENNQGKSLHWVRFAETVPFNAKVGDLKRKVRVT